MKEKILNLINRILPRKENRILPRKEKILEIIHRRRETVYKGVTYEVRHGVFSITNETRDRIDSDMRKLKTAGHRSYDCSLEDGLEMLGLEIKNRGPFEDRIDGVDDVDDIISRRFDTDQNHFIIRTTEQIIIIEANRIGLEIEKEEVHKSHETGTISNDINLEDITVSTYESLGPIMRFKITIETDFVPLCFCIGHSEFATGNDVTVYKARIESNQLNMRFYL